jgi:phosphoribosylanthranilate isomerase
MTHVKVCGLTRAVDVRLAVALGAWACGFVLSASPRRVTPKRAARLARLAGRVLTVAVVTTESAAWIAEALAESGLAAVQLSAGADGPTVAEVRAATESCGRHPRILAAAETPDAEAADLVLFDARLPGVYGGTGTKLDWPTLAAELARADQGTLGRRLVLAGGLAPDNVCGAIAALSPYAVDVSSGVELADAPGRKDPNLLVRFFAAVATSSRTAEVRP